MHEVFSTTPFLDSLSLAAFSCWSRRKFTPRWPNGVTHVGNKPGSPGPYPPHRVRMSCQGRTLTAATMEHLTRAQGRVSLIGQHSAEGSQISSLPSLKALPFHAGALQFGSMRLC